ncbi:MAG: TMEM175 family protein, partial [Bacteroidota bacterium]|nr:TMEM175 family protein [Bacteroidota bacterium]
YVVSFMVLAVYWIGHHNQFHLIASTDRTLLWINIFFLMSIAFVPFSTGLLASYNQEKEAVILYGANVIFSGIALYLHWVYASGKGNLIHPNTPKSVIYITKVRILTGIGFYIVTTAIAFLSTRISLVLFAALPFMYMFRSRVDNYFKEDDSDR